MVKKGEREILKDIAHCEFSEYSLHQNPVVPVLDLSIIDGDE